MATQDPPNALLSADHPCTDPRDDRLGYAPFAKMLAHSALRGSPAAGLVVGIFGEWGLGKTTVLNFVEHFAKADVGDDAPIIVRFNPWWFSGREDLLRRFFKEFENAVLQQRAKSTRLQSALQKFGEAVATMPSAWVATAGKLLTAAAKMGQPGDLIGLKAAVKQALAAEPLRVIVLIDDIDRLLPPEMTEILRLVRSVGDFPNVHYVLAFERRVVADALQREFATDGDRFLEKIVQVPFDLPRPTATTLYAMFTRQLDGILASTDEALFDQSYWNDLFIKGVAPFLRTPRDVVRLLNVLSVIYPSVRNEVNPVDFVGIEALRVFAPNAHEIVASSRERFVGIRLSVDHLREDNQRFHERWLADLRENKDEVRELVTRLFPIVAALLAKNHALSGATPQQRMTRRICSDTMFDVYFRYQLGSGLTRSEFRACLQSDPEALRSLLVGFLEVPAGGEVSKFRTFLDMLFDELIEGSRFDSEVLIRQLCWIGDAVISRTPAAFSFRVSDDFLLVMVIDKLLVTMQEAQRAQVLKNALAGGGLCTAARVVTFLGAQHGRHGESGVPQSERTIPTAAELDELEGVARSRIEQAAVDGRLWQSPALIRLLFDWHRLGGGERLRGAVRAWSEDAKNFVCLVSSLASHGRRGELSVDIVAVSMVLDLEEAVEKANAAIEGGAVTSEQNTVLQALIKAYSATEAARQKDLLVRQILAEIVGLSTSSGSFPKEHRVGVLFESHRKLLSEMRGKKLIAPILSDCLMVTIQGLLIIASESSARAELELCSMLFGRVKSAYREDDHVKLALEPLATEFSAGGQSVGVADLQRATLRLLVHFNSTSRVIDVSFSNSVPSAIGATEGILDVSPNWSGTT